MISGTAPHKTFPNPRQTLWPPGRSQPPSLSRPAPPSPPHSPQDRSLPRPAEGGAGGPSLPLPAGPRPQPGQAAAPASGWGRGHQEGSLPLGRCLLHAAAGPPAPPSGGGLPAQPLGTTRPVTAQLLTTFARASWPFKRGSRPPSAAAAAPGLSQATATTATYPAAGGGPPPGASQWLQPAPSQVLIGLRGSRSERQGGRGPTPPREERAASRRREGKNMEAAVPPGAEAPRSRHAPRGRGPRGTPGGVVLPRNLPYPFLREGWPAGPGRARHTGRRRNRGPRP